MKAEARIFGACTVFFMLVTPTYWFVTDANSYTDGGDWTGTSVLFMTFLLVFMITIFLGFHASKMDPRPEDRADAEIADGAGELGFFPPYSWWPLWCALTLSTLVFAIAVTAWWMAIIAGAFGGIALAGWVYEYYRGEHAH